MTIARMTTAPRRIMGDIAARLALAGTVLGAGAAHAQTDAEQAIGTGVGSLIAILMIVIVGAIVGWLASLIVKGSGSGFFTDVLIGIGGSLIGGFLFRFLGVNFGTGILASLVPAVVGAVLLLLIVRLIRRGA